MAFAIRNLSVLAYANGCTVLRDKVGRDGLERVETRGFVSDAADMLASGRHDDLDRGWWPPHPVCGAWRRWQRLNRLTDVATHGGSTGRRSTSRVCRSDPVSVISKRPSSRCLARFMLERLARQGPSFSPAGRPHWPLKVRRCRADRQQVSRYGSSHTGGIVGFRCLRGKRCRIDVGGSGCGWHSSRPGSTGRSCCATWRAQCCRASCASQSRPTG
jgi:hypothetical protein